MHSLLGQHSLWANKCFAQLIPGAPGQHRDVDAPVLQTRHWALGVTQVALTWALSFTEAENKLESPALLLS